MASSPLLEPGPNVIGVTHGWNDAQRGADERARYFRHQFLARVGLRAEGPAEVPTKSGGCSTPMAEFVKSRAMPVDRLKISLRRRNLHEVAGGAVEGSRSADAEFCTGSGDERLGRRLDQPRLRRWRDVDGVFRQAHGSAQMTPRIRAELQASKEKTSILARRYGLSRTMWTSGRCRTTRSDAPMGSTAPHSTVLTPAEEAIVVEFRRQTLLPLDDVLGCLRDPIPKFTRSSQHRCVERHGISRLSESADKGAKRGRFAESPGPMVRPNG